MQSLEEILGECERLHGHMCAGQLLGARMALLVWDRARSSRTWPSRTRAVMTAAASK